MVKWTASDIPAQNGRVAIVTGTGGLGFEDALVLAGKGAEVIIAGRNREKGRDALARIRAEIPEAKVSFEQLDLAQLSSVADFAARVRARHDRIDLLVNNAGVMVPPERQTTSDGFELQFGTNYLGHFALTAHMMPLLRKAPDARVVSLSSVAARDGQIGFSDLQSERQYRPMKTYSQSKLACLMFAFELQRKSVEGNWGITSIAAHPGVSRTDLLHNAPGRWSIQSLLRSFAWFAFQPAWQGALPTLYAATAPAAEAGGYYGPDGLGELRGYPARAKIPPQANDHPVSARLWTVSEELAEVRFPAG